MPYIKKEDRERYNKYIRPLSEELSRSESREGDLNYVITKLVKDLYGQSYSEYNEAIGVLEACKLELYRTQVGPYEEGKRKERGDIE